MHRLRLTLLLAASVACAPSPADQEARFLQELQSFRAAKDAAFLESDSPVPADKQPAFLPLAYFPPSTAYRAPAVLKPLADTTTVTMPTSTGQWRKMRVVGTLEFTLRGQPMTLGAFVDSDARDLSRLFVPFTDLTSGSETYPAGRYIDLDVTRSGIYVIDFNRAYNPYCYYNPTYDCPFPPRSNRLQVPIRAGEKVK